LGGCQTGQAKLTKGYNLPAKYIIHTVGPVWRGGNAGEAALLAECYQHCIELASANGIETIAFPCISTGIYGYPIEAAALIAVNAVRNALASGSPVREVTFCTFRPEDLAVYVRAIE
jgi:O-acetyl-ADP-ribose deacetylase (regulator of RNase III)